jgi:hypothetical protein
MKYFLIITFLFLCACSETKQKQSKDKLLNKNITQNPNQPPPEREIIDLKDDPMTFEQVQKIDKEIPVLEIIANDQWTQSNYDQLAGFEMLDTIRFEKVDVTKLDLSFISKVKSLKVLSLAGSGATDSSLEQIKNTNLKTLDISETTISAKAIVKLKESHPDLNILVN